MTLSTPFCSNDFIDIAIYMPMDLQNVVYILTGMTVLSIGGPGILYFPVAYPGVSLQTGKVRVESP